jgi:hypothetical protein
MEGDVPCPGGMTTRSMAISVHLLPFDPSGSLSSGTYNVLKPLPEFL